MTVEVKQILAGEAFTDPATGQLTVAAAELLQRLVLAMQEQQTTTADHETRITALEP